MAGDSTQQNNGNSEKVQGLGAVLTVIIFLATVINFLFPEPSQALLLWAKNNPLVAFVFVGLTVVVSWVILSESAPIRHLLAAIWEKLGVILLIAAVFGLVTIILRDSSPPEPTVTLPPMGTETPTTISVSLTPALTETPVPIQVSSTPTAPTLTLTPIIITPTAKNAVATATPADTSVPPPQPWVSNSQYVQCGTVDGQVALGPRTTCHRFDIKFQPS
jgi:membrane protease YdiL (CAAX protease family)